MRQQFIQKRCKIQFSRNLTNSSHSYMILAILHSLSNVIGYFETRVALEFWILILDIFYHFVVMSWVRNWQHSAQMILLTNNKMITRKYLQNDSSISLEWWLQQNTGKVGTIITRKSWNHRTCLGPKSNENKIVQNKHLLKSLGQIICLKSVTTYKYLLEMRAYLKACFSSFNQKYALH